jgi:beta-glucosidase
MTHLETQQKIGQILDAERVAPTIQYVSTAPFANQMAAALSPLGQRGQHPRPVDVTNTGTVAGDAVAQIYIHHRYGTASRPVRQLKGFERVALQPGETKTLTFSLGKDELKYWNPQTKEWIVEPSQFDVWAGEDSTASLHA